MMMEYDKMKDNRWRIKAPELVIILLYLELVRNLISLPALEDEPPLNVATTAGVTDENIYDVLICNCEGDIVFLDICNSAYLHPYFQHFLQIRRTMQA